MNQDPRSTGDPGLDRLIGDVLDAVPAASDRDQLTEILVSAAGLAGDGADRLDLKITNAALSEMRDAFKLFAPFAGVPKVTIFGSARTRPDDPLYIQTRDLARSLAGDGWLVVTGAGPGIMAAGVEGAGPERSIGVNIRLPFETPNPQIADLHIVSMKYFFTRKLMLMKESSGFAVLPGGFGTLDETFELLTLEQTGKATPSPIVLLDVPGGTYWRGWEQFVREELAGRGLISADDLGLVTITDDTGHARDEILGFYRNYHSIRFVGQRLVVRVKFRPTDTDVESLNRDFADIVTKGRIVSSDPLAPEVGDADHLELPRLTLNFDRTKHGRLRALIDALNRLPADSGESPDRG